MAVVGCGAGDPSVGSKESSKEIDTEDGADKLPRGPDVGRSRFLRHTSDDCDELVWRGRQGGDLQMTQDSVRATSRKMISWTDP